MTVSKRLRFEILRRDNHQCRYCGTRAPEAALRVDHVIPVALGGTDDPTNLVASCFDCNAGKSSSAPDASLVEDVSARSLAWARALDQARAELAHELRPPEFDRFDELWDEWQTGNRPAPRPADWRVSVKVWLARGMTIELLGDCIETAMVRDGLTGERRWPYFCGVAWNTVKALEERTEELARAGLAPLREDL